MTTTAQRPQLSDPAAEWERCELLELGESIVAAVPSAWPAFQKWMSAVRGLSDEACASFSVEAALMSLTMELRRLWLRFAHEKADRSIKSPLREAKVSTSLGSPISYGYERSIQPHQLEGRCFVSAPAHPADWASDHVLFSSAQSALAALLHWARSNKFWDDEAPHLTFAGNYFETQHALNIFAVPPMTWSREKSATGMREEAERASRTILIEPVFYDEAANVLEIPALQRALATLQPAGPALVILDTTLTGPLFPIDDLLQRLGGERAPIVITFRSGLKLDQAGLELVNVGIVSIYRHRSTLQAAPGDVGSELRHLRTVLGTGLTLDEISALEAPWFLKKTYMHRYATAVFENNARLAEEVQTQNRMFAQVLHPRFARPECAWACAPYSVLRLNDPDPDKYRLLERVIAYEANRRGISFDLGGSFGFRGHRFEAIIPDSGLGAPFLRVAMGARGGASWRGAVQLLCEIAMLQDFDELRRHYEAQVADMSAVAE
jgi:hypothetical protein